MLRPVQFPLLVGGRDHQGDVLAQLGELQGGADWVGGVTFCCEYQHWNIQDLKQPAVFSYLESVLGYLV